MINKIFEEFSNLPQVDAIALGGSRATNNNDQKSDYDVYIYVNQIIPIETRNNILKKYSSYLEINNTFWETEDNGTLVNGIDYDILYRDIINFSNDLEKVVIKHEAHNNYTTCFWHNLLNSKIIFDRNGSLAQLINRFNIPYSDELKNNIINRGMKLLRNSIASFEGQLNKAIARKDIISIQHRATEFIATYFDIIYAINKKTHPGEKRLIELTIKNCPILPANFKKNIETLLIHIYSEQELVSKDISLIIDELIKII